MTGAEEAVCEAERIARNIDRSIPDEAGNAGRTTAMIGKRNPISTPQESVRRRIDLDRRTRNENDRTTSVEHPADLKPRGVVVFTSLGASNRMEAQGRQRVHNAFYGVKLEQVFKFCVDFFGANTYRFSP